MFGTGISLTHISTILRLFELFNACKVVPTLELTSMSAVVGFQAQLFGCKRLNFSILVSYVFSNFYFVAQTSLRCSLSLEQRNLNFLSPFNYVSFRK
jgi:hypothetical protein